MEKILELVNGLEAAIKGLTPSTPQLQSALNGVSHVRDNVKGHFEAVKVATSETAATAATVKK